MHGCAYMRAEATSAIRQIRTSILFCNGKEGPCQSGRLGPWQRKSLRLYAFGCLWRSGLVEGPAGIEGDRGILVWLRSCEALVLYAVAPRSATEAERPWLRKCRPCS